MELLLCAATEAEIKPFIDSKPDCEILITGVGMVATAYQLGKALAKKEYDLVINAGIAGAFDKGIALGSVFQVSSDCLSEMGAEDGDDFIPFFDMGFADPNGRPYTKGLLVNPYLLKNIPQAEALTVNTVHGNEESIVRMLKRKSVQIETMEGAAFFYACLSSCQPCTQIRSISNYVERRNRAAWNISLAIEQLNKHLIEVLLPNLLSPQGPPILKTINHI